MPLFFTLNLSFFSFSGTSYIHSAALAVVGVHTRRRGSRRKAAPLLFLLLLALESVELGMPKYLNLLVRKGPLHAVCVVSQSVIFFISFFFPVFFTPGVLAAFRLHMLQCGLAGIEELGMECFYRIVREVAVEEAGEVILGTNVSFDTGITAPKRLQEQDIHLKAEVP